MPPNSWLEAVGDRSPVVEAGPTVGSTRRLPESGGRWGAQGAEAAAPAPQLTAPCSTSAMARSRR